MMRNSLWIGVVLSGAAVHTATAQQAMSSQMSMGVNQSMMSAILEPVTDAQYQADKVSRSVQTLSDGTVITHETRGLIARDAQGRTREDIYMVHSGQISGKQVNMSLQSATVGDPVAHSLLIWAGGPGKIAMKMQLPTLPKTAMTGLLTSPPPPLPSPPGSVAGNRQTNINMPNFGDPNSPPRSVNLGHGVTHVSDSDVPKDGVRTEELGQQSIEGLLVTGKRVTTTIPIGKVDNDRPIVVVHEEWRSPDLKIVVKTIDTDPRTGVQTMELQGLTRTDPDAALFLAPAGYQVKDMADMLKSVGDLGKSKAQ
jgi:hypothetical protein